MSLFVQFWIVQSLIGQLVFLSVYVLFQIILSNIRLDRSKLDENGHKVVKSPTALACWDQLNSTQFRVFVGYFSLPFSSSFDLFLFLLVISQSLFVLFWPVQSPIGQLAFSSISVLFPTILSSARLDRSIQFSWAQFCSNQLNSAQFSPIQLNSAQLPSLFVQFRLFLFYSKQFCPMLDWTGQNWTKRNIKLWNHQQQ